MDDLSRLMQDYCSRTRRSRSLAETAARLAEPPRPLAYHPLLGEVGYPMAAAGFAGCRFSDVDGNDTLDFSMGLGSALFGHAPAFLTEALQAQLTRGFGVGPRSPLAQEVADLVVQLSGMERVVFASSGSEAVMLALRLARAASLRPRIALFAGSYHGQCDGTLAVANPAGAQFGAVPAALGVTRSCAADVVVLPYGEAEALECIDTLRHELAAVLVEPVQAQRPDLQPAAFLRELRRLTTGCGIALVFDEMMTGFRLAQGGAQAHFGVQADLAVYGKVLAGGMPLTALAGAERYLDAVDGGAWGPAALPRALTTFTASTFASHPLSLAAARAVLHRLAQLGPGLQQGLNERCAALVDRLNAILAAAQAPLRYACCGSYFAPLPPADEDTLALQLLHRVLAADGVFLWGLRGFLSTAHEPRDLDRLCAALAHGVGILCAAGHVPGADDAPVTRHG